MCRPVAQLHRAVVLSARLGVGVSPGLPILYVFALADRGRHFLISHLYFNLSINILLLVKVGGTSHISSVGQSSLTWWLVVGSSPACGSLNCVSAINLQFLIIFGSEGVNSPSSL